jgi:uncharacterized membrane-anchored protein YhcB (DUF1043 family)
MMILQTTTPFDGLTNYGVLGIVTLALGYFVWQVWKRQVRSEDALKTQVSELQQELRSYIKHDQSELKKSLDNNTGALNELRELILSSMINQTAQKVKRVARKVTTRKKTEA